MRPLGFTGELTILRNYLRALRDVVQLPRAFIRVESSLRDWIRLERTHAAAAESVADALRIPQGWTSRRHNQEAVFFVQ